MFEAAATGRPAEFCSTRCRVASHRHKNADEYTAKSIRILRDDEIARKFEWAEVESLAAKYRRTAAWIKRGLDACETAGVAPEYFIRRYLDDDKTIPKHEGVEAAFVEALQATQR
jgi:hypothetical protein